MIRYVSDKLATNEYVIGRSESAAETATTEKSLHVSMCTLTWGMHSSGNCTRHSVHVHAKIFGLISCKVNKVNLLSTLYYMSLLFNYKTVAGGRLHSTAQQSWSSPCFQNCPVVCKSWIQSFLSTESHETKYLLVVKLDWFYTVTVSITPPFWYHTKNHEKRRNWPYWRTKMM